jgi:starvation-inducible DNA-binding protein
VQFAKLSSIKDDAADSDFADWKELVRQLLVGNEAVCKTARKVLKTTNAAGDDPSVDLLTQRLQTHEKYAWMLRSLLE